MSPDELMREMQAIREVGWVFCDWRSRSRRGGPSAQEIDAYIEVVDLGSWGDLGRGSPEEGGWEEIEPDEAKKFVIHWLRHDLADGLAAKGSQQKRADSAADSFLSVFTGAVKLYTNAATDDSWTPKTRHTFDRGIVVIDDQLIGLVWFADED